MLVAVPWRALRGAAAAAAAALGDEDGDAAREATADDMALSQVGKCKVDQDAISQPAAGNSCQPVQPLPRNQQQASVQYTVEAAG